MARGLEARNRQTYSLCTLVPYEHLSTHNKPSRRELDSSEFLRVSAPQPYAYRLLPPANLSLSTTAYLHTSRSSRQECFNAIDEDGTGINLDKLLEAFKVLDMKITRAEGKKLFERVSRGGCWEA